MNVLGWRYFWVFLCLLCGGDSVGESWAYVHVYLCTWSLDVHGSLARWPPRSLLSGPICLCVLSSAVHFLVCTHSSCIICGKHLFTMETSHSVEAWETHYLVRRSRSIWYSEVTQIILPWVVMLAEDSVPEPYLSVDLFKNTNKRQWIFKLSWFHCDWSEPIFKVIDDIAVVESVSANNY